MIDELCDIAALENILIMLEEGASDERRSALHSIKMMIGRKTKTVEDFEANMEMAG